MRKLLMLSIIPFLAACQTTPAPGKVICGIQQKVVIQVSTQLSEQLECKAPEAVVASIETEINKLSKCRAIAPDSVGGDIVCTIIADAAANATASKIPSSWQCSGGNVKAKIRDIAFNQCKLVVK